MSFINKNIPGAKPPIPPREIKLMVSSEGAEVIQAAISTLLLKCTTEELLLLAQAAEKPMLKAMAISQLKNYI